MSSETVGIAHSDLVELLARLSEKRAAVEKEFNKIPAAPKAARDVFQLCRGFERAFAQTLETVGYSAMIREAFAGDKGLSGIVRRLPIERQFRLDNVKMVCREADGFQRSLVSPEAGLRRLVHDSVETVLMPVDATVRRVHQVLIDASREAARKASAYAEDGTFMESKEPLRLPAFEKVIGFAVQKALEDWRDEALEVAKTLVGMEQSYVSAAFFRHLTKERLQRHQAEQLLAEGGGVPAPRANDDDDDDSDDDSTVRSRVDSSPSLKRNELQTYDSNSSSVAGPLAIPSAAPRNNDDPGELKTGYLEKRVGEHSGRQSVPLGESFKWQKRYFVLTEPKGMLYYFKSADDPPNYRGVINLRECRVQDVTVDGTPIEDQAKSKIAADQAAGSVSLLIKIGHKDTSRPIVKNHHSVVLRAESAAEKYSWLTRLLAASGNPLAPRGKPQPGSKPPSPEQPKGVLQNLTSTVGSAASSVSSSAKNAVNRLTGDGNNGGLGPMSSPGPQLTADNRGLGSAILFHETSGIGPEPMLFGEGTAITHPGATDARDAFLKRLAEDTVLYVRTVCNTIIMEVPKAIVHCQVKRAEQHLLEALYGHISSLGKFESDTLLEEDPDTMQRRAATRKALEDLVDAVGEVKALQERTVQADRSALIDVSVQLLDMAGMKSLIPSPQRTAQPSSRYGNYGPAALSNGSPPANGPPSRRISSDRPPPQSQSQMAGPVPNQPVNRSNSGARNSMLNRPPSGRSMGPAGAANPVPPSANWGSGAGPQPGTPSTPSTPGTPIGSPGVVVPPRRRPPPAPPAQ
ncbi:hypothetical protein ABBQ32_000657 [Trebouxia sp. C0010 RCD-2024]